VERGERAIGIDDVERLARALGVEPADLCRGSRQGFADCP
jgi:hypothetical protein